MATKTGMRGLQVHSLLSIKMHRANLFNDSQWNSDDITKCLCELKSANMKTIKGIQRADMMDNFTTCPQFLIQNSLI